MTFKKCMALLLVMAIVMSLTGCVSFDSEMFGSEQATEGEIPEDPAREVTVYLLHKEGSDTNYNTYKYDDNGNLIVRVYYHNGKENERNEYAYDGNGNLIKDVYYRFGKEYWCDEYEYDSNGCVTTMMKTQEGTTSTSTYTYTQVTLTLKRAKALQEAYGKEKVVIVK